MDAELLSLFRKELELCKVHEGEVLAVLSAGNEKPEYAQAFLVGIDRLDGEPAGIHSAVVQLMAGRADPRHQFAFPEHGSHRGDVGMMDGAQIGIVADEDVAVLDGLVRP